MSHLVDVKSLQRMAINRIHPLGWAFATLAFCSPLMAQQSQTAAAQKALIDKYCVTCHNDKLRTGGLSFESIDVSRVPEAAETWEKAIRKLRVGAMPPQGLPRPDK